MQGPGFAAEEAGWLQRMVNVFNAPQSSFAAVLGRESALDWLLPVAVTCLVGLGCHYLTIDTVSSLDAPAVQEKLINMSEQERAQYEQSVQMLRAQGWTMVPVGHFSSLVFVGAIMLIVARLVFHSEMTFRQSLIVKGYATLVISVEWVVRALMVLATDSPFVFMGPGMFVGDEATATFLGRVLMNINFFDLWQLWIMGIGLSMLGSIDRQRAQWTLAALWVMWLFGGAGLEILGAQAGLSAVE
ncbi:MAG: hypothetical protein VX670_09455 [Candidatus Latescibacterota bacterium]|nr:hypothetical protein [Candidatus Latescibacterota bacterium]MEE2727978.1 hypothetical protein [Candidatus Latescibacterota bacterium]